MDINIKLGEGVKISAEFGQFSIESDQSIAGGGEGSAPEPFDYFLASSALCAGFYIKAFCNARKIDTTGIKIVQKDIRDPLHKYKREITIEIEVPEGFPDKYKRALVSSAKNCSVKKSVEVGPDYRITIK